MGFKMTDETRDQIVTMNVAYGMRQCDIAEKLNLSSGSVATVLQCIGLVRDGNYEAIASRAVGQNWGRNMVRWAFDRCGKTMPVDIDRALERNAAERKAKKTPPAQMEIEEPVKPETEATGTKVFIPAATAEMGWQTRIKVKPDRLCMTVYFNGVPQVEGYSKIKGDKELDLMQAISYAAHMCYKIVEQKKLGGH